MAEHLEDYTDRCGACKYYNFKVSRYGGIRHWGYCELKNDKYKTASQIKCKEYEEWGDEDE